MKVYLEKYISERQKTEVIFDLDQTLGKILIDWTDDFRIGIRNKLAKIDNDLVVKFPINKTSTTQLVYEMVKEHGGGVKNMIVKCFRKFEIDHYHGIQPNKKLIGWVNKNTKLNFYIWTNNTQQVTLRVLKEMSLLDKWKKIVTVQDVKNVKPDSDGFRLIKNKDVSRKRYLLIGDSKWDEMAAKEVGIDFIKTEDLKWKE